MAQKVTLIGFGEAGQAFAGAEAWRGDARAYDRLTDDEPSRAAKQRDYARAGVTGAASTAEAVASASLILSLVTADQALAVAGEVARHMVPGALFCDLNSIAPATKRAAAQAIEPAGGRYVDVAIMSPVHPARLAVPLLVAGPHAEAAEASLRQLGFSNLRAIAGDIGTASSIKMIRSVMVKGIEALTAECMLAAQAAGVTDAVLASLDASEKARPWAERADYNLDRMIVHGLRRAEEMEEVVKTLEDLGVEPALTRGTVIRQRAIGSLGLESGAEGLAGKLEHVRKAAS